MNENDEWKKEESNEPRSSKYLRIPRDLIRLGFDSTSAWKFVFVKWFPENPVCTQDVTLLLWAKLQQVSAAPRERKLLHKERRNELITMYNWYLEVLRDRVWSRFELGPSRSWLNWNQTSDKTGYLILFSGFTNCQLNFPFQHANFSGDRYLFSNTMNEMQRKFLSLSNTRKVIRLS